MNSLNNTIFPFGSILNWYAENGRHTLPWRHIYHLPVRDRLYRVWIAEVMLQQTQVDRVISYYTQFLEKYPTIESLANTTYEELFPYWQGLGYYSRARRMIELARIIVERHQGIFPEDFETLQKLPGIGKYTAQALLAFGYNQPVLAVDANLIKIFARYYFGTKFKNIQSDREDILIQLQKQVQKENISGREMNNALMDFGALVSTKYELVKQDQYPLTECRWIQTEGKLEIKKVVQKKERHKNEYFCLVFLHESHKKYWSSNTSHYEPFLIEPTAKDDRRTIQDYFSATYSLEVSVRPSFSSELFGKTPVRLFHAQIQTGNIALSEFPKDQKEAWMKKNIEIF